MEKRNSQLEHGQPMEQTKACFARATQVRLAVEHNTSATSGKWVRCSSVLLGKVSLAAVNQICVIHEAINGRKNLNIYLRIASKLLIL